MKKKQTVAEKIAHKKYKPCNKFLWWFFNKLIVNPFIAPKFKPHYNIIDDIKNEKGPCFLIYNHQSRMDYVWAVQSSYPRVINFVAGYNEFHRSKFSFVFSLLHQIPKKNFTTDIRSIKAMQEIIKQNGIVCMSPEGMSSINGHNQPVAPGTGKLFKHYDIPVYVMKSHGAFLTSHKVSINERTGRVDVDFYKLFTPEQLNEMTPEDIETKVNEALWQDDYEWEKEHHVQYKTKGQAASHLHDLCYKCPRCGEEFQMLGKGDTIKCLKCGNGAKINDYYEMIPLDDKYVLPSTPAKWADWEREIIKKEIRENPNYVFTEDVKLGKLPDYHLVKHDGTSEICGEGKLIVDHQGYHYRGTKDGEEFDFDLSYKEIHTIVIVTDCTFSSMYVDGVYYDFFPARPSVGKLLLVVEEMHRLHENSWKQLPWLETFSDPDGNLPPIV